MCSYPQPQSSLSQPPPPQGYGLPLQSVLAGLINCELHSDVVFVCQDGIIINFESKSLYSIHRLFRRI